MIWIAAILILLLNECTNTKCWSICIVRNFALLAAGAVFAQKCPGLVLMAAIIALSAFVGWELYQCDTSKRR